MILVPEKWNFRSGILSLLARCFRKKLQNLQSVPLPGNVLYLL